MSTVKPSSYCSQPNTQYRFHLVKPNFIAISGLIHITTHDLMHKSQTNSPHRPHIVRGLSNGSKKILTIRSQVLGPIKQSFKASTKPKHHKTLKQSVKPSRINPLLHGVCQNSKKPVPTHCPLRVEQLSLLLRRIPTVGSPRILERRPLLSL